MTRPDHAPAPLPGPAAVHGSAPRAVARGGARLREDRTAAIESAAVDELAEQGYGRFSMASVASRAGVGKAAIYRRWATKEELVADLAARAAVPSSTDRDTGTLAGDLAHLLRSTRDALDGPRVARIIADLLAESLRDRMFGDRLRRSVTVGRRENVAATLQRAVGRGEIADGFPVDAALDLVAGPLVVRLLVEQGPLDDEYLDGVLRLLLGALGRAGRGGDGPRRPADRAGAPSSASG